MSGPLVPPFSVQESATATAHTVLDALRNDAPMTDSARATIPTLAAQMRKYGETDLADGLIATLCTRCWGAADEAALDNYLDAHQLKTPHPTYPGVSQHDPLTAEQEAEVEQWALMLMTNADDYWNHTQEHARGKSANTPSSPSSGTGSTAKNPAAQPHAAAAGKRAPRHRQSADASTATTWRGSPDPARETRHARFTGNAGITLIPRILHPACIPATVARMKTRRTLTATAALLLTAAVALTGCGIPVDTIVREVNEAARQIDTNPAPDASTADQAPTTAPTPAETTTPAPVQGADSADVAAARDTLATLPTIFDRPNVDGYDRECGEGHACVFGPSWHDDNDAPGGHNGCDTRNDLLARTLTNPVFKPGSDCVVISGAYVEPYFGTEEQFVKGEPTATQDEVDHVIALALAWDLGAHAWSIEKRRAFANNLDLNLVLTTRQANSAGLDVDGDGNKDRTDLGEYEGKYDKSASEWLEWLPDPQRACTYAVKFVKVTAAYDLPILEDDKAAILTAFDACQEGA